MSLSFRVNTIDGKYNFLDKLRWIMMNKDSSLPRILPIILYWHIFVGQRCESFLFTWQKSKLIFGCIQ